MQIILQVYYCSASCQQSDRKSHKKNECFPCELVEEINTATSGSGESNKRSQTHHWISTRDIKANELIFSETSLINGPCKKIPIFYYKEKGLEYIPVCLACHRILNPSQSYELCSRCKWPICNIDCENVRKSRYFDTLILMSLPVFRMQNILEGNVVTWSRLEWSRGI